MSEVARRRVERVRAAAQYAAELVRALPLPARGECVAHALRWHDADALRFLRADAHAHAHADADAHAASRAVLSWECAAALASLDDADDDVVDDVGAGVAQHEAGAPACVMRALRVAASPLLATSGLAQQYQWWWTQACRAATPLDAEHLRALAEVAERLARARRTVEQPALRDACVALADHAHALRALALAGQLDARAAVDVCASAALLCTLLLRGGVEGDGTTALVHGVRAALLVRRCIADDADGDALLALAFDDGAAVRNASLCACCAALRACSLLRQVARDRADAAVAAAVQHAHGLDGQQLLTLRVLVLESAVRSPDSPAAREWAAELARDRPCVDTALRCARIALVGQHWRRDGGALLTAALRMTDEAAHPVATALGDALSPASVAQIDAQPERALAHATLAIESARAAAGALPRASAAWRAAACRLACAAALRAGRPAVALQVVRPPTWLASSAVERVARTAAADAPPAASLADMAVWLRAVYSAHALDDESSDADVPERVASDTLERAAALLPIGGASAQSAGDAREPGHASPASAVPPPALWEDLVTRLVDANALVAALRAAALYARAHPGERAAHYARLVLARAQFGSQDALEHAQAAQRALAALIARGANRAAAPDDDVALVARAARLGVQLARG